MKPRRPLVVVLLLSLAWAVGPLRGEAAPDLGPPPAAERHESGLVTLVLEPGEGSDHPLPEDEVLVRHRGWTSDGSPLTGALAGDGVERLALASIMPGWAEALQRMVEGEKRRCWIPQELAFRGMTGMPAGTLIYELELLEILSAIPRDLAAPPEDAQRHPSGLISKLLQQGTGSEHPDSRSLVTVRYTGWTVDGRRFDGTDRLPARFFVYQLIPGWAEGLQSMVRGEKRRLWIPQPLAYRGRSGKPRGTLVFDVELIDFE